MASSKKIGGKISKWAVVKDGDTDEKPVPQLLPARPPVLRGKTYKIETPLSDHSLYVTINDIVLNPGTPEEFRKPFELFVNTKSTEHFQWIVGLTRITSAVFRRGGSLQFLVKEFKSVHDPKGGYPTKNGYVASLVAEIGIVLERHLLELSKSQAKGEPKDGKKTP
jgi:hypothetical protein